MDYIDLCALSRHTSWQAFKTQAAGRIVLLTTKTDLPYYDFSFRDGDILLLGRESAGVPLDIHAAADAQITIKMAPGARSLNVINAGSMVLGEALRQSRT